MFELHVNLPPRPYPICVGSGAGRELPRYLSDYSTYVIVTDQTVAALHGAAIRAVTPAAELVAFTPGEASKTLATAAWLYERLAAARIGRRDALVALGGGVVGDLAGFVAATWLRGIDFIQMPTTIEAAVDASVGGKTGVNLPAGKNLVGAFHQPAAVLIDTDFLNTLPERDFCAGLAESIKHAVIRDPEFLAWHEQRVAAIRAREPRITAELIERNCRIKAAVVEQDEREIGLRAILNHGHTVGHALEHVLSYELRHGECVALGMIAENAIAAGRGLLSVGAGERIRALIAALGLPTKLPRDLDRAALGAALAMDKKNTDGAVNYVLLTEPGKTVRVSDVSDAELGAALRAIAR